MAFLKQFIGTPQLRATFVNDQLALLEDMTKRYLIRFPFQNVSAMNDQHPTDKKVTSHFFDRGGTSSHQNILFKYILDSVGFHTKNIIAHHHRNDGVDVIPGPYHAILVNMSHFFDANSPDPKGKYLLDVGSALPMHLPVHLCDLPFKGRAGGFDYVLDWNKLGGSSAEKNTFMERAHVDGNVHEGAHPTISKITGRYHVDLEPTAEELHMDIGHNPMDPYRRWGIYCFRYLDFTEDDFEAVCVHNKSLLLFDKETRSAEYFDNPREMAENIHKYFPMIPFNDIQRACEIEFNLAKQQEQHEAQAQAHNKTKPTP